MTLLASPDEDLARDAFGYLFDLSRPYLDRYLQHTCNLWDSQARADVAQTSSLRLWSARQSFENKGASGWRAWIKRTAFRCFVDYLRTQRRLVSEDEFDVYGVPHEERSIVDAVLISAESDLSSRIHDRRLLAAELFYVDREPWTVVLRLLGPTPPGEPALTRAELDRWLSDPGVLRHLAFRALYYDSDRLAAHLLGLPDAAQRDERARALDALMDRAANSDPAALCEATGNRFNWGEVMILLWRFRNAMSVEQIHGRLDRAVTDEAIRTLVEQCVAAFPFASAMQRFLAHLEAGQASVNPASLLAAPGLWQRLALEYRYRDDLAHRDIEERIRPASAVVGYEVTPGMLNVWLSNGRLIKRLARLYQEQDAKFNERQHDV